MSPAIRSMIMDLLDKNLISFEAFHSSGIYVVRTMENDNITATYQTLLHCDFSEWIELETNQC